MEAILIIIAIVFLFLYFYYKKKKKTHTISFETPTEKQQPKASNNLYKKKGIKEFSINGIYFRKLKPEAAGSFIGYVKCEKNKHDKYAVAVFNNDNQHLGYTPKGNVKLSESLRTWHTGEVISWGNLRYEEWDKSWTGYVYIPVGYSESEIKNLEEIFVLLEKRAKIQEMENPTTEDYFEILEDHMKIKGHIKIFGENNGIYYEFSKKIIPSFSKKLESEKDWKSLLRLENYNELIDELNEKFSNSTYKRIEKAKKNLP